MEDVLLMRGYSESIQTVMELGEHGSGEIGGRGRALALRCCRPQRSSMKPRSV